MKVRLSIVAAFVIACIGTAYLGFTDIKVPNDKLAHGLAFFVLALLCYWSVDLPRKRAVNGTLLVVTAIMGIGSEFLQHFFTNREFDYRDIAANIAGSLFATVMSSWYHGRLVERRRKARYNRLRSNLGSEVEQQVELTNVEPEAEIPQPTQ